MQFNLEIPINPTSFGNISVGVLRELHERGLQPNIFPIGQIDLQTQAITEDFTKWLQHCINKAPRLFKRSYPSFRLWHLNGGHTRISDKTVCLTFYETDNPTETELNIIRNLERVLFTSNYTKNIFEDYGADNVGSLPLAFDHFNFKQTNKPYINDRLVFNIVGKFEHRKRHAKIIQLIAKHFGNNKDYHFQFAIYNPFFKPEDNKNLILQILGGRTYWNMQFLGFMGSNQLYNDYLNSAHAVIGLSGGENWGLPEFHSVGLGKHALILNANGYKEWANNENSVLINPNGKIPAYDGVFFNQGQPYNQGNFFEFDEEDFLAGFHKLVEKIRANPVNTEGLKLQQQFTWKKTVDSILKQLEV